MVMIQRQTSVGKTRYIIVVLAACFVWACGGSGETARSESPRSRASDIKRAEGDKEPVPEHGKRWGGWRWRGKRDTCFFVYRNKCYSEKAKACRAAKCGPRKCKYKGGGPAEIYCKK